LVHVDPCRFCILAGRNVSVRAIRAIRAMSSWLPWGPRPAFQHLLDQHLTSLWCSLQAMRCSDSPADGLTALGCKANLSARWICTSEWLQSSSIIFNQIPKNTFRVFMSLRIGWWVRLQWFSLSFPRLEAPGLRARIFLVLCTKHHVGWKPLDLEWWWMIWMGWLGTYNAC
jgi:hypothetical protein